MQSESRNSRVAPGDGFFIPDLCAAPAVFFAVLLAELAVFLHVLALGPLRTFDWQTMAVGSLFVQWITLLCLALLCRLRVILTGFSPTLATLACLVLVAGVTIATSLVFSRFAPADLVDVATLDLTVRNTLLAIVIAAIVLRYAYLQQRVAQQQRSELQLRLAALQARIRPHFLFNTLNSIASLLTIPPDRAEAAIEDVSELFRAALSDERSESTLAHELHLCKLYLAIEALRLEDRLSVEWSVEEGLGETRLPSLLLQPLIENAVYHGVAQLPAGGTIEVTARRREGSLRLSVANPVPDAQPSQRRGGNRMALDNIRQRLQAVYDERGSLHLREEPGRYVAELVIPRDPVF